MPGRYPLPIRPSLLKIHPMNRPLRIRLLLAATLFAPLLTSARSQPVAAEELTAIEKRLSDVVRYLASDDLEGRGIGTKGLDIAADYIADEFKALGLQTELYEGTPFHHFEVTNAARLGPAANNRLQLVPKGTDGDPIELKHGTEFNTLSVGGSAEFDLPLVFIGYGISAPDLDYDDYEGIDVEGKAVIMLRHEPQRNNPHSAFAGDKFSRHAFFRTKVSNAYQHGATAVLFCTSKSELDSNARAARKRWNAALDELTEARKQFEQIKSPTEKETEEYHEDITRLADQISYFDKQRTESLGDPLVEFRKAGEGNGRVMPVLHCQRAILDKVLQDSLGKTLAELEAEIDNGPTPRSVELPGWQAVGQTDILRDRVPVKNVVALLEAGDPSSKETIVLGAHYDHLGYGGPMSAAGHGVRAIYNGADDNGSGTAVLLEVARLLKQREPLPRRILFIAFTGEERGLLGSAKYIKEPAIPLKETVAMFNLDMVGRLRENKLIVNGSGTADEFPPLLTRLNERYGFKLKMSQSGFGPSDHTSFYTQGIPVLHLFTGSHSDYHRPSDDFEKLNVQGMARISEFVAQLITEVAKTPKVPTYVATKRMRPDTPRGTRPYFGSIPDFGGEGDGYAISGVSPKSPAARGGLQGGDAIISLGGNRISNLEDFDTALRKFKAGDKVEVIVIRDESEKTLKVVLDPPR